MHRASHALAASHGGVLPSLVRHLLGPRAHRASNVYANSSLQQESPRSAPNGTMHKTSQWSGWLLGALFDGRSRWSALRSQRRTKGPSKRAPPDDVPAKNGLDRPRPMAEAQRLVGARSEPMTLTTESREHSFRGAVRCPEEWYCTSIRPLDMP